MGSSGGTEAHPPSSHCRQFCRLSPEPGASLRSRGRALFAPVLGASWGSKVASWACLGLSPRPSSSRSHPARGEELARASMEQEDFSLSWGLAVVTLSHWVQLSSWGLQTHRPLVPGSLAAWQRFADRLVACKKPVGGGALLLTGPALLSGSGHLQPLGRPCA